MPVYNKRMIEYPVKTLVSAGVKDIILITGGSKPGSFLELFKNGKDFGINKLYYTYQEGNGGIADALSLAEPFMRKGEDCVVILGDNYFESGIISQMAKWKTRDKKTVGSICLVKETDDPWSFGIVQIEEGKIISIEEKPESPKTNLAILGCYFFDEKVWGYLYDNINFSSRGEKEVTSVLEKYMNINMLSYLDYDSFWSDMGTFENLMVVSNRVSKS